MFLSLVSPSSFVSFSSSTFNRPTNPTLSTFSPSPISCSFKPFWLSSSHSAHRIVKRLRPIRNQTESDFKSKVGSIPLDKRWSLRGTTALVTGGTRGIGRAIVEELVGFGARVYTCSRNESELKKCLRDWNNLEFEVSGSVCDVSVRAQREELMETVAHTFDGKLNILVNNVGRNIRKPTTEFTDEEFSFLMKTNVESVFHLSQLAYPLLKASGEGSIVFMSSVSSFVSLKSMSVQGATKGDQLYQWFLNILDANISFLVKT